MSRSVSLAHLGLGGSYYDVDANGTRWCVTGWPAPGAPASSMSTTQKIARPGAWLGGAPQPQARSVPVNGWVKAQNPALLQAAFDDMNEACALAEDVPLVVTIDGQSRWLLVRRQGEVVFVETSDRSADWSLQLQALEPRWFADALSLSTGLPRAEGGLTVPFTIPFTIDATHVSGSVSLNNPGRVDGPVVIRIDGPCQGPVITHTGSGKQLVLATDLVLGQGQFITVDMENELVLAQGQSERNGWIVERGFSVFSPGDNTWLFTHAGNYNDLAQMGVTAWPAWP